MFAPPTTWDSSSLQKPESTLSCFHLCTHSRFATLRPDNHNGRDGIGPSPGRNKGEKTSSHQVVILTTLFRSVASRARTPRHLSAPNPDHDRTMHTSTTASCSRKLRAGPFRAGLEGQVSRLGVSLGWRPNCLRLPGMPRHCQRNLIQGSGHYPKMSSGSLNAKGICHCNPRCALQDNGGGATALFFSQSEGSSIRTSAPILAFPNMANKDKRETDPARQSIPTVPPWAETSKQCASSCTAIAFLLVASDGHRNGRFSTQNNPCPPDRKSPDFATGTPIKGSSTPKSLPATLYMQRRLALVFEKAGELSQPPPPI